MNAGVPLGVATGEEAWVVRKHVGHEKRVAGKSLDLTVTLVIGNRIWGYSWDTSYEPCRDVRIWVMTGKPRMDIVAMSALGL